MATETCSTGICKCSMGMIPATFIVKPDRKVDTESNPAGTIEDNVVGDNLMPAASTFGLCTSLMNPDVMQATMAAAGILTPQPCKPQITMPWMPGSSTVLIGDTPALGDTSQLMCNYMGVITFVLPGEFSTHVPM